MSDQHTAGVLHVVGRNKCALMTEPGQACRTVAHAIQSDDARRLAACWNACQGLSTESLERLGTLDRARVSRDVTHEHMRAALQQALPIIDAYRRLSGGDGDLVAANIRQVLR